MDSVPGLRVQRPVKLTSSRDTAGRDDASIVAAQLSGRSPRGPWRIAARCSSGFPVVIVSPSMLDDGTPFPSYAWLTCPFLAEKVAAAESGGAAARWAARAAVDRALAAALRAADRDVRAARARESGGVDACAHVGLAGQRDPLGVKCLHAHVALALAGIADPVGIAELEAAGYECTDAHCEKITASSGRARTPKKES